MKNGMIGKNVIVRSTAGVFAGVLVTHKRKEATVSNARRLWFWDGAASLSELAVDGTSKPEKCKFPVAVEQVYLADVLEILPLTAKAWKSISAVPIWTAKVK